MSTWLVGDDLEKRSSEARKGRGMTICVVMAAHRVCVVMAAHRAPGITFRAAWESPHWIFPAAPEFLPPWNKKESVA